MEKTIKVGFLSVVSTTDKTTLSVFIARSGPTHDAMSVREERPSKQRDKKFSGGNAAPQRVVFSEISEETPKSRRCLAGVGRKAAAFEIST